MAYELRNQPRRGIYLVYQLLSTALVRVPLWILISIPRSWRPRNSWTLKRCLFVRLIRHLLFVTSRIGPIGAVPSHTAIAHGVDIKGVWIDSTPELVTGEVAQWASVANVKPIRIPGYWLDKKGADIAIGQTPVPGEKVVYCLHGGAYTRLSAHPRDPTAAIARGLLKHLKPVQRAFSLEYRLSKAAPYEPSNPFPAALIDALAGYNYLINIVGFKPEDIIIEGDSAGGNLTLALTRYLVKNWSNPSDVRLPAPPGAILLLSPWVDISDSHDKPGSSSFTFHTSDYLGRTRDGGIPYHKAAFLGPHGFEVAKTNPYISPASLKAEVEFAGFPKTFIVAGGAEQLLDQIRTLRDRMTKDLGAQVTYYEAPDAVHDYIVFPWIEPERGDTLRAISKWVDSM